MQWLQAACSRGDQPADLGGGPRPLSASGPGLVLGWEPGPGPAICLTCGRWPVASGGRREGWAGFTVRGLPFAFSSPLNSSDVSANPSTGGRHV